MVSPIQRIVPDPARFALLRLDKAQSRLQVLYDKQGRTNKFKTKQERDTFLRNEVKTCTSAQEDQNGRITEITEQIDTAEEELADNQARREELEQKVETLRESVTTLAAKRDTLSTQLNGKHEQRK